MSNLPNFFLNAFYEAKFADALFVVKASGDVIEDADALDSLIADIKLLILQGTRVLLVYGAGSATDKALAEVGIDVVKKDGRRVTDAKTLDVMKGALGGRMSLRVQEAMAKGGLNGLSFNAVPNSWLDVEMRPKAPVDFGFVGDIKSSNTRAIARTFKASQFIACACLATTNDGDLVNINADTVAVDLAIGANADKILLMSNIEGVKIDGKTAPIITCDQIDGLIKGGQITGGMRVKMENCARALSAGVGRIHIMDGTKKNALSKEIFESVGPGTMVMRSQEKENYLKEIEIHKQIEEKTNA